MENIINVAVVGAGAWGTNLVRTFAALGALRYVVDTSDVALERARAHCEGARTINDLDIALADPSIDAVVIAAPAAQHFTLAQRCLSRGKDVYVEKPLALHAGEGKTLVDLAAASNRLLMVGHILEYHPAILELKRLITVGELGRVQYIYSSRVNLGKLRTEENILWSFAPHDIAAIMFILNEQPVRVSSHGGFYLNRDIADTTLSTCEFASGVKAHIFVSWLHPFKEQKLTVVGDRRMAVFDDVSENRKLVLYSHEIRWLDRIPVAYKDEGSVVVLPPDEPLRCECEHFLRCVATRETPRTDGHSGVEVLRVLEGCEQSLRAGGAPQFIASQYGQALNYQAHSTAVIEPGCQVGSGTRIWHFTHLMEGATLGRNCNIGQNVVISPGVTIGNNVKIQNNVSVYTGVELEDDVFCGPSMVFTNVINPRSHVTRRHEYRRTLVQKGASIGANATIVCGIRLGKYCFVAAGAVVTRDVPDYALVAGVPARRIGWVCYCGTTLPGLSTPSCKQCGRTYRITSDGCMQQFEEEEALSARAKVA